MNKKFNELIGFEGNIIEVSNKLKSLGCEDVCQFDNWSEILNDKNAIVATDEFGDSHIKLFFDILFTAGKDEDIQATYIKINNVEEY